MHKLIIAAAMLVGLAGAAVAQEAPALIYSDSYDQNVRNVQQDRAPADSYSGRASASQQVGGSAPHMANFLVNEHPDYSGR